MVSKEHPWHCTIQPCERDATAIATSPAAHHHHHQVRLRCHHRIRFDSSRRPLEAIVLAESFGGGLVAGDHVDVRGRVQPKARLALLHAG